jgi:hypothetical protein
MSATVQRPCRHPGCSGFAVDRGCCAKHAPAARAAMTAKQEQADAQRGTANKRGYDARWGKLSRRMRELFPISLGYLTRTEFWTHNLAQQFHTLRMHAQAHGEFVRFMLPNGAGARFLEQFPIYDFHRSDRPEPSEVTDHIIPHRGDPLLFWAEWNLQPISKRQHDTKTATEDGGFRGAKPTEAP